MPPFPKHCLYPTGSRPWSKINNFSFLFLQLMIACNHSPLVINWESKNCLLPEKELKKVPRNIFKHKICNYYQIRKYLLWRQSKFLKLQLLTGTGISFFPHKTAIGIQILFFYKPQRGFAWCERLLWREIKKRKKKKRSINHVDAWR